MANLTLSAQDIDYIGRVARTEVAHHLAKSNPQEYQRQVEGVVDTIMNRVVSPSFPNSVEGVVNAKKQFSKITGPSRLSPYGSVQETPEAPASFQSRVSKHIAERAAGKPSIIGGHVNYANPHHSTKNNQGWIEGIAKQTGIKLGAGTSFHYHGSTNPNAKAPEFKINAPSLKDEIKENFAVRNDLRNPKDWDDNRYAGHDAAPHGNVQFAKLPDEVPTPKQRPGIIATNPNATPEDILQAFTDWDFSTISAPGDEPPQEAIESLVGQQSGDTLALPGFGENAAVKAPTPRSRPAPFEGGTPVTNQPTTPTPRPQGNPGITGLGENAEPEQIGWALNNPTEQQQQRSMDESAATARLEAANTAAHFASMPPIDQSQAKPFANTADIPSPAFFPKTNLSLPSIDDYGLPKPSAYEDLLRRQSGRQGPARQQVDPTKLTSFGTVDDYHPLQPNVAPSDAITTPFPDPNPIIPSGYEDYQRRSREPVPSQVARSKPVDAFNNATFNTRKLADGDEGWITVEDPRINNGNPSNIPGIVAGVDMRDDPQRAADWAVEDARRLGNGASYPEYVTDIAARQDLGNMLGVSSGRTSTFPTSRPSSAPNYVDPGARTQALSRYNPNMGNQGVYSRPWSANEVTGSGFDNRFSTTPYDTTGMHRESDNKYSQQPYGGSFGDTRSGALIGDYEAPKLANESWGHASSTPSYSNQSMARNDMRSQPQSAPVQVAVPSPIDIPNSAMSLASQLASYGGGKATAKPEQKIAGVVNRPDNYIPTPTGNPLKPANMDPIAQQAHRMKNPTISDYLLTKNGAVKSPAGAKLGAIAGLAVPVPGASMVGRAIGNQLGYLGSKHYADNGGIFRGGATPYTAGLPQAPSGTAVYGGYGGSKGATYRGTDPFGNNYQVSRDPVTGRTGVTNSHGVTTIQSDGNSRQAATGGFFGGLFG